MINQTVVQYQLVFTKDNKKLIHGFWWNTHPVDASANHIENCIMGNTPIKGTALYAINLKYSDGTEYIEVQEDM